jgi:hypothetical protein
MSDTSEPITSKYQVLVKPEFTSSIPAHLTAKLSDQERYLVETLSKMEQQTTWLVMNVLVTNKSLVDVDTEVQVLKDFKKMLVSKWTVIAWVVTLILPMLLQSAWSWIVKHIP